MEPPRPYQPYERKKPIPSERERLGHFNQRQWDDAILFEGEGWRHDEFLEPGIVYQPEGKPPNAKEMENLIQPFLGPPKGDISFEEWIAKSCKRYRWHFAQLDRAMHEAGYKDFSAEQQFIDTSVALGRVMTGNVLVIPSTLQVGAQDAFFQTKWEKAEYEGKEYWKPHIESALPQKKTIHNPFYPNPTGGTPFGQNMGFIAYPAKDAQGNARTIYSAIIGLDPTVCRYLRDYGRNHFSLNESGTPRRKSLEERIVGDIRRMVMLRNHDYFHGILFGESTNRTGSNIYGGRIDIEDRVAGNAVYELDESRGQGTSNLEIHAMEMHRVAMESPSYRQMLQRKALGFLEAVAELKERAGNTEEATQVAQYLTYFYLHEMGHMVDMGGSFFTAPCQPRTRKDGSPLPADRFTGRSIADAVEALNLPPFQPQIKDITHALKSSDAFVAEEARALMQGINDYEEKLAALPAPDVAAEPGRWQKIGKKLGLEWLKNKLAPPSSPPLSARDIALQELEKEWSKERKAFEEQFGFLKAEDKTLDGSYFLPFMRAALLMESLRKCDLPWEASLRYLREGEKLDFSEPQLRTLDMLKDYLPQGEKGLVFTICRSMLEDSPSQSKDFRYYSSDLPQTIYSATEKSRKEYELLPTQQERLTKRILAGDESIMAHVNHLHTPYLERVQEFLQPQITRTPLPPPDPDAPPIPKRTIVEGIEVRNVIDYFPPAAEKIDISFAPVSGARGMQARLALSSRGFFARM
jgi:hypothetical protein